MFTHLDPWNCSLPATKTANSCTESHLAPPGLAESSPPRHLLLSPRTHLQTAAASSHSTFPSSPGAKLLTWLPLAAPQMAMQACIPLCPHSAKPHWTSTSFTCPALSPAKSPTRGRTRRKRWRTLLSASKVAWQQGKHC